MLLVLFRVGRFEGVIGVGDGKGEDGLLLVVLEFADHGCGCGEREESWVGLGEGLYEILCSGCSQWRIGTMLSHPPLARSSQSRLRCTSQRTIHDTNPRVQIACLDSMP